MSFGFFCFKHEFVQYIEHFVVYTFSTIFVQIFLWKNLKILKLQYI